MAYLVFSLLFLAAAGVGIYIRHLRSKELRELDKLMTSSAQELYKQLEELEQRIQGINVSGGSPKPSPKLHTPVLGAGVSRRNRRKRARLSPPPPYVPPKDIQF
jgi:hypothetical protein